MTADELHRIQTEVAKGLPVHLRPNLLTFNGDGYVGWKWLDPTTRAQHGNTFNTEGLSHPEITERIRQELDIARHAHP